MTKALFDSNILIYSIDGGEPKKQAIAQDLIRGHAKKGFGVISTQALHEFFSVCVSKLRILPVDARTLATGFSDLQVIAVSEAISFEAMELSAIHQLSIWDSLMISAAIAAKCPTVFSEDLQSGFSVRGVTVSNPFTQA